MVAPSDKADAASYLQQHHQVSERRACQVLRVNRNTKRSLEHEKPMCEKVERVIALSEQQDRWGYRKVYDRMKLDGANIGRERVRLIRKCEGLQVRRKQGKKLIPNPKSQR